MKKVPAFVILTVISLVAAILLAVTDRITKEPIRQAALMARDAPSAAVWPGADGYREMETLEGLDSLYAAEKAGEVAGYVATVTARGYAGPVEVTVGLDTNHMIIGISVGGNGFAETPALAPLPKSPALRRSSRAKRPPYPWGRTWTPFPGPPSPAAP